MERLFVAIPLPSETRTRLAALQTDLRGARWTPAGQLHLTLLFLGDTEADAVAPLVRSISALQAPPLALRFGGLGVFPNLRAPRVLVAHVQPDPHLMTLAAEVRAAAATLDFAAEARPFRPHVTLARLRDPDRGEIRRFLEETPLAESFVATEMVLYASRLTPQGAIHDRRAAFPLAG